MAMDPVTETFSLIGPCRDLCHTVRANAWARPSFASLPVPFNAILSCWCKSLCDPAMPKISKIMNEETEQLTALARVNVTLGNQSSDDYSDAPHISNIWESK